MADRCRTRVLDGIRARRAAALHVGARAGRTVLLPLMLVAGLVAACEDPQRSDVKARLVGTWFVESARMN